MASVSELKHGIRVINWFANSKRNPDVYTFQCGQTSLELRSNFGNYQAGLTLQEILIYVKIYLEQIFTLLLNV